MHWEDRGGGGDYMVAEGSVEFFCEQRVKDMEESTKKNAQSQGSQQRRTEAWLHGFHDRSVFLGKRTADCAILRKKTDALKGAEPQRTKLQTERAG